MAYVWTKTAVGSVMAANFAVPLFTILRNRHLWDDPMVMLAGNMSLVCSLSGLVIVLIGLYDVFQLKIDLLCRSMQYVGFSLGIEMKVAHVCMALDQFVAVTHPLRHFTLMMRARPWLFAGTWLTGAAHVMFGAAAIGMHLETFAEAQHGVDNDTRLFPECRWESSLANVYTIVLELESAMLSLLTAGLLLYTGIIGHRTSVSIRNDQRRLQDTAGDQAFFEKYSAFKRILLVLSLVVTLDIVSPVVRLVSRWYPMPRLNGFLHLVRVLGFIFEGWSYGLLNLKLRAAYKRTFCGVCLSRRNKRDEGRPRENSAKSPKNSVGPTVSVIHPVPPLAAEA